MCDFTGGRTAAAVAGSFGSKTRVKQQGQGQERSVKPSIHYQYRNETK